MFGAIYWRYRCNVLQRALSTAMAQLSHLGMQIKVEQDALKEEREKRRLVQRAHADDLRDEFAYNEARTYLRANGPTSRKGCPPATGCDWADCVAYAQNKPACAVRGECKQKKLARYYVKEKKHKSARTGFSMWDVHDGEQGGTPVAFFGSRTIDGKCAKTRAYQHCKFLNSLEG